MTLQHKTELNNATCPQEIVQIGRRRNNRGARDLRPFGRRVSFLAEGVKRDSEEAHLLKTVASGGPWHSEVQGEEALLTRLKDWAKSPPK